MKKQCIVCDELIPEGRLKALPTTKVCINCSHTGKKRGLPVQFGKGDHTYIETILLDEEEYEQYYNSKLKKDERE
jgi:predicted metal-binding protein